MGEPDGEGLPHPIPVAELQSMLEGGGAHCSDTPSNLTVSQPFDRWPFLFSHPLMDGRKEHHSRYPKKS